MTQPPERRIELDPDTPIARAVARAREAFKRKDPRAVDRAFTRATPLAGGDRELWRALAVDHVARLHELGSATLAAERCDQYLRRAPGVVELALVRAEIRSGMGAHDRAKEHAREIRIWLRDRPDALDADGRARLLRVEGLAAANDGRVDAAASLLTASRKPCLDGADALDRDRQHLGVREGVESDMDGAQIPPSGSTVAQRLRRAIALKRQQRYEKAFDELQNALGTSFDPALRSPMLREMVVLLLLMHRDTEADRLLPLLREAAGASPDTVEIAAFVSRLTGKEDLDAPLPARMDQRLHRVSALIAKAPFDEARLDEAEQLLKSMRDEADGARDVALWHFAAGELERARYAQTRDDAFLHQAVAQLSLAAERAEGTWLAELRGAALRLLGHTLVTLGDGEGAARCWGRAHHIEEEIAYLQETDATRVRMLRAAATEHDQRVRAAVEAVPKRGAEAALEIAVAMEAARGATILQLVERPGAGVRRDLPGLGDIRGARRWVREACHDLPRSQAVWMIYPTPDRVHHVLLARDFLHYDSAVVSRADLLDTIDELRTHWSRPPFPGELPALEKPKVRARFSELLSEVSTILAVHEPLRRLPGYISRIAIVAGGSPTTDQMGETLGASLADIPFAALGIPGTDTLIGERYALSDLPCLSVRRPLSRRARGQRGDSGLLVRPPDDQLTHAAHLPGRTVLDGESATPDAVGTLMARQRHRRLRIDAHGVHDPDDSEQSWLQLAPAGAGGRLRPDGLRRMALSRCGSLVMGACESGMGQARGRDELTGLVRAGFEGGAGAVVAARWIAHDEVAAAVLDRFERNLRLFPRDVALQRAQLAVLRGAPGTPGKVDDLHHPARWACWAVYGDSGWQTRAGSLRRWWRRMRDRREGV